MKINKSCAFLISVIVLTGLSGLSILTRQDGLPAALTSLVALAGLFFGANVADNGVKGKFYRPELDGNKRRRDE